jgi:hypothetical protein
MIKHIKTEKFEGLAVLVPDDARNFDIGRWAGRRLIFNQGKCEVDNMKTGSIELGLDSEYEILGKANELTEEQRRSIVSFEYDNLLFDCIGELFRNYLNHSDPVLDSVQAFNSLMESLECYSFNPYTHPSKLSPIGYNKNKQKWKEAQANIGTWLIIGKI